MNVSSRPCRRLQRLVETHKEKRLAKLNSFTVTRNLPRHLGLIFLSPNCFALLFSPPVSLLGLSYGRFSIWSWCLCLLVLSLGVPFSPLPSSGAFHHIYTLGPVRTRSMPSVRQPLGSATFLQSSLIFRSFPKLGATDDVTGKVKWEWGWRWKTEVTRRIRSLVLSWLRSCTNVCEYMFAHPSCLVICVNA